MLLGLGPGPHKILTGWERQKVRETLQGVMLLALGYRYHLGQQGWVLEGVPETQQGVMLLMVGCMPPYAPDGLGNPADG